MKKRTFSVRILAVSIVILILGSGYMMGTAIGMSLKDKQEEAENKPLEEEYGLLPDMADEELKEQTNKALLEGMKFLTIEPEIHFEYPDSPGEARISNGAQSSLAVKCTVIRNATGEIVYSSKLIDPGHYIETIYLLADMKKGYYPCTVVWTFYSLDEEVILGETASNVVLIVEK